jgi:hypothetical protein
MGQNSQYHNHFFWMFQYPHFSGVQIISRSFLLHGIGVPCANAEFLFKFGQQREGLKDAFKQTILRHYVNVPS